MRDDESRGTVLSRGTVMERGTILERRAAAMEDDDVIRPRAEAGQETEDLTVDAGDTARSDFDPSLLSREQDALASNEGTTADWG